MKEAAGEANLTVITIVLIAIVVAVATPLITNIMGSTGKRTCCTNAGGQWKGNTCVQPTKGGYYDEQTYNDCIADLGDNK